MRRQLVLLAILTIWSATAVAQCRPGDHLLGEDAANYYCSPKTCGELARQLETDKEALRRLLKNITGTNDDLARWTQENNAAAQSAFKRAGTLLHDAVLGSLEGMSQQRLNLLKSELQRRAPVGQTWQRLIEQAQDLDKRKAKLTALVHGFKLSQYPFSNLTSAYADLKNWAVEVHRESEGIVEIFRTMRRDPEGTKILNETGLSFVSDSLKMWTPLAAQPLALGEFFVNYGYDATAWAICGRLQAVKG